MPTADRENKQQGVWPLGAPAPAQALWGKRHWPILVCSATFGKRDSVL